MMFPSRRSGRGPSSCVAGRVAAPIALLCLLALAAGGCMKTFTASPLKSDEPVEISRESASIGEIGLESAPEPALAVKVTGVRRAYYEAWVVEQEITRVRYARAVYVLRYAPF